MAPKQTWTENEDAALFRSIVQVVLASRTDIYRSPALEAFTGHGSSVINANLQQLLKKFSQVPGAATILAEEVAALTKNKKATPAKAKATMPKTPTPKKRKMVKSEEEMSEEDW